MIAVICAESLISVRRGSIILIGEPEFDEQNVPHQSLPLMREVDMLSFEVQH